jgi:hypothetical protein
MSYAQIRFEIDHELWMQDVMRAHWWYVASPFGALVLPLRALDLPTEKWHVLVH